MSAKDDATILLPDGGHAVPVQHHQDCHDKLNDWKARAEKAEAEISTLLIQRETAADLLVEMKEENASLRAAAHLLRRVYYERDPIGQKVCDLIFQQNRKLAQQVDEYFEARAVLRGGGA